MAKKKPKATGDCNTCPFWKMKNSRIKGKLIPGGYGKCSRQGGPCNPEKTRGEKEKGDVPHTPPETTPQPPANGSHEVNLSLIYPNPDQPRKFFPREALEELALSIKEQGLIEPLVVVPRDNKFMLVAGERRWRACQMAGLETVPVRVIEADDRQIAEMALVENLQRQDLTPLEEARAFREMLNKGYTKEELARKLGFKQVWRVDERLSLLNLAPKFQEALTLGALSPSQAFEMSRLTDHGDQELVFRKIRAGELTTYNHLRRFVTAMADARKQTALFALPKKEDLEIVNRWEKVLDAVTGLVCKSFSPDDCRVLARVHQGNAHLNLTKIDLIIQHLNRIKKAMLENASRQEVSRLAQGGESLCEASSSST
jgi:ParB family transcriptional regulator, chromosome partitioning protein